jgi:hypothetical protein
MKMKLRNSISLGMLACIGLCGSVASQAQTWQLVGPAGFTASGSGVANWQRLLVDEYNNLYLSYNDEGFGISSGQGTVMKFNGTNWVSIGTPGFTTNFAHHSDFTFGGGDTLYFSYADGSSSAMSRGAVMMYNGTTWSSIGSLITTGECQYSSLAVADNGTLYLGMIDNGVPNGAMVVKKYDGGTSWSNVGASPISTASGAAYADFALDKFDTPYVVYQDKSEAPGKVRVKKYDGTNWVNVGDPLLATTGPGAGPAMDIYIAFDINNKPYVSYSHTFQGPPRISVERFNGTTWELVGPAQFSSGQFETSLFSSLALPKDAPYVAYQHGGLGMKASVKKYNTLTSAWENVGTPAVSDDVSAFTSIAVDGNSNVYVAYFDQANGNKNTVKKFTVCEAPVIQTVVAENSPICEDSATLKVTGVLNDASQWQWFTGACNAGTAIGIGDSIKVSPNQSTTYYVKGLGGCVISGGCMQVTVDIAMPKPTITLVNNVFTSSAASGNQWYRNSALIPGAINQTYTATQQGYYYSRVTSGNCSRSSDSLLFEPTSITGVNQNENIKVYPVPFDGNLNIKFDDASLFGKRDWQVKITDKLGREVYQSAISKSATTLNLKQQAAGLYFVKIYNGNESYVYKVVKK